MAWTSRSWQQYITWLSGVVRLDFGQSFEHPDESVIDIIKRTWPTTMHLGAMALIIAFGIGIPLGIIAAYKQNSAVDYVATLLSVFGFVTPHFVWGILFIMIFRPAPQLGADGRVGGAQAVDPAGRGLRAGSVGHRGALHAHQRG